MAVMRINHLFDAARDSDGICIPGYQSADGKVRPPPRGEGLI